MGKLKFQMQNLKTKVIEEVDTAERKVFLEANGYREYVAPAEGDQTLDDASDTGDASRKSPRSPK